jgi:hypothetical protein
MVAYNGEGVCEVAALIVLQLHSPPQCSLMSQS